MKHIDQYLMAGKPVIGLRTATHAFSGLKGEYDKYNWDYKGPEGGMEGWLWPIGLRRNLDQPPRRAQERIHPRPFAPDAKDSPLVNGIQSSEIWVPTDVYGVRLPLPGDAKPIILGQVTKRSGPADDRQAGVFYGMRPTDERARDDKQEQPDDAGRLDQELSTSRRKAGQGVLHDHGQRHRFHQRSAAPAAGECRLRSARMKVPEKADVDIVGDFKPEPRSDSADIERE